MSEIALSSVLRFPSRLEAVLEIAPPITLKTTRMGIVLVRFNVSAGCTGIKVMCYGGV